MLFAGGEATAFDSTLTSYDSSYSTGQINNNSAGHDYQYVVA